MANKLKKLMINRTDLVDSPSNPLARVLLYKRKLDSKDRKDMSDSEFAYISPDGTKHLPINDAAHVRDALARLDQTDISSEAKATARRKIEAAAQRFGVKVSKRTFTREDFCNEYDLLLSEFADRVIQMPDGDFIKREIADLSGALSEMIDVFPFAKSEITENDEIFEKYEKTVDVLEQLDKLILGGEISVEDVAELLEGFQMADKNDKTETVETLKAKLAETETALTKAKKDAEDKQKELDDEKKKKKDDNDDDDMKKKAVDIWKGVNPEIKAQFEAMQKSTADAEKIAKAAEENAATVRLEKRVNEDISKLHGTVVEKTALLRAIEKVAPADQFEKLFTVLKSADAVITKSLLLDEKGSKKASSGSSALEKLNAKAKEIMVAKGAKTDAEAFKKAVQQNPELYKEYINEGE
jgi:hypothetical protein